MSTLGRVEPEPCRAKFKLCHAKIGYQPSSNPRQTMYSLVELKFGWFGIDRQVGW